MARKQKPLAQGLALLGWDPNASTYSADFCPGCRKRPDPDCACCGAPTYRDQSSAHPGGGGAHCQAT